MWFRSTTNLSFTLLATLLAGNFSLPLVVETKSQSQSLSLSLSLGLFTFMVTDGLFGLSALQGNLNLSRSVINCRICPDLSTKGLSSLLGCGFLTTKVGFSLVVVENRSWWLSLAINEGVVQWGAFGVVVFALLLRWCWRCWRCWMFSSAEAIAQSEVGLGRHCDLGCSGIYQCIPGSLRSLTIMEISEKGGMKVVKWLPGGYASFIR